MAYAQQVCPSLKVVEASSVSLSYSRKERVELVAQVVPAVDAATVKALVLWMMTSPCFLLWPIDCLQLSHARLIVQLLARSLSPLCVYKHGKKSPLLLLLFLTPLINLLWFANCFLSMFFLFNAWKG